MSDEEPDFSAVLGWDAQPSAAAGGGDGPHDGLVVVAHSGGDGVPGPGGGVLVPVPGGGVLVPVPANEDPQTPCAPRRKHRKSHGAFSGKMPERTIAVRRAFSNSGNLTRWSAYREKQLQAGNI